MSTKEEKIRDILARIIPGSENNAIIELYEETRVGDRVLIERIEKDQHNFSPISKTESETKNGSVIKIVVIPSPIPLASTEDEVYDS